MTNPARADGRKWVQVAEAGESAMRTLGLMLAVLLAACASRPPELTADLILQAVNVVDVESGNVVSDQDVIIDDGRIVAVQASLGVTPVRGVRTVDARGQYLIPALWDLHVHLEAFTAPGEPELDPSSWHVPLAMSYGVLGMRDMGSRTDDILALRDTYTRLRAAGEPGPLLRVAGQSFSGTQPWGTFDHTLVPGTPEQAASMVREQIARGVDFIKVHDFIDPEIYRAIVSTARGADVSVVGHLRPYAGPLEATALGHFGFDHIPPELLAYCGANGRRDTEAFYAGWYTGGPGYFVSAMAALHERNGAGCSAMFAALATQNVTVTPTLSVRAPVKPRTYDVASRYLPTQLMTRCASARSALDETPASASAAYQTMISAVVLGLNDAGIEVLTGSDAGPCGVPGLILLDEMDELVAAGLSRRQALRSATMGAARAAGVTDAGVVDEGALADLVLLASNPIEDFASLQEPVGVVSAGRYLDRTDLLALREQAASYARSLSQ